MYHAMCEEVHDVEKALCDVRTMLQEQQKTLAAAPDQEPPTAPAPPWQAEWTEVVQQVAAANAGWAWRGFWTMVLRNLECPPCPVRGRARGGRGVCCMQLQPVVVQQADLVSPSPVHVNVFTALAAPARGLCADCLARLPGRLCRARRVSLSGRRHARRRGALRGAALPVGGGPSRAVAAVIAAAAMTKAPGV